jgi:hypothetical protein
MLESDEDVFNEMVKRTGMSEEKVRFFIRHLEGMLRAFLENPKASDGKIVIAGALKFRFRTVFAFRQWYRCLIGLNGYEKRVAHYNEFLKPKMTKYVKIDQERYSDYGFGKNPGESCSNEVSGVEHYQEVVHPWRGREGKC